MTRFNFARLAFFAFLSAKIVSAQSPAVVERITTYAGTGSYSAAIVGDGGPATSANIGFPEAIALDSLGNLFVSDLASRVRKVNSGGIVSTIAGNGFGGDGGPAIGALVYDAAGLAVDAVGNLYIADSTANRIRKVTLDGIINTVVGSSPTMCPVGTNCGGGFSGDGGPATLALLDEPTNVVVDTSGNLFIADTFNERVRKVTPNGTIITVAGTGAVCQQMVTGVQCPAGTFSGDGGPATSASLYFPGGLATDTAGNLFIVDAYNRRVRKVNPAGIISTVAGNGASGITGDGGPATSAALNPSGVAVDSAGNLFISDYTNHVVRRVDTAGIISTVTGTGVAGFSGDGGPAILAQLNEPIGVAVDRSGNLFIADAKNNRVREVKITEEVALSVADRGGVALQSSGALPSTVTGYASIQPTNGTEPAGLAIFGFRENNVLVSEASVPASPLIQSGRIYSEVNGQINTGLAIANPNNQPAVVSFFFTNSTGDFGSGSMTVPPNGQIAKFLSESPFTAPPTLSGTFTFTSSVPIAVIALRGLTNERGEFLLTTLPVADLQTSAATVSTVFPHFADGGGWTTQLLLVNATDAPSAGTVQFLDQSGQPVVITVNGQANSSFAYSLSPRSSQKLQTSNSTAATLVGSVRILPDTIAPRAPSGLAIFSYRKNGVTVSEAGVPASAVGTAFRLYAEGSTSTQTGLAVTNMTSTQATVAFDLSGLDGSPTGLNGTISLPANGQTATFLSQVPGFAALPANFQGVLRVSSSSSISVTGLEGVSNERADFLITTIPPINEAAAPTTATLFFPQIVDSGGYTTRFILLNAQPGSPLSAKVQFFSQAGGPWNVTFQ